MFASAYSGKRNISRPSPPSAAWEIAIPLCQGPK